MASFPCFLSSHCFFLPNKLYIALICLFNETLESSCCNDGTIVILIDTGISKCKSISEKKLLKPNNKDTRKVSQFREVTCPNVWSWDFVCHASRMTGYKAIISMALQLVSQSNNYKQFFPLSIPLLGSRCQNSIAQPVERGYST